MQCFSYDSISKNIRKRTLAEQDSDAIDLDASFSALMVGFGDPAPQLADGKAEEAATTLAIEDGKVEEISSGDEEDGEDEND